MFFFVDLYFVKMSWIHSMHRIFGDGVGSKPFWGSNRPLVEYDHFNEKCSYVWMLSSISVL